MTESVAETNCWRVNKISDVLARAGLTAYKMRSGHVSPFADPVERSGYLVQSREFTPDCVYAEWIDHYFGHGTAWRCGNERIIRALRDARYTVEEPGACGPVGQYKTHDYMRVTYQPRDSA